MSVTSVPEKVKFRLWGKAAGRCEYSGCNKPLWLDEVTRYEFNTAYIAHIVADEPKGPRGDEILSPKLSAELSNLMLLCDAHHRLIDKEDVAGHPVERLAKMKLDHEARIERLTAIDPDRSSHILLYGANIGQHSSHLTYDRCAIALPPAWYPASTQPISIGLENSSFTDGDEAYWQIEARQIRSKLDLQLKARVQSGEVKHVSVFAKAPQPCLVLLGTELSELIQCEVYQLRKEPPGSWSWEDGPDTAQFAVEEPTEFSGKIPALVFSLSGTVLDDRIHQILGDSAAIWRVTIPSPHNDFVRSRGQVAEFRRTMRPLLDRIKARHGDSAVLHVFPAMPVSLAVEFGRVVNLKADLPMLIYDEQKDRGGFVPTLKIGPNQA